MLMPFYGDGIGLRQEQGSRRIVTLQESPLESHTPIEDENGQRKQRKANSQADRLSGGLATPPDPPGGYSSSSPKKKRCAQRWLQKIRPYSRLPQSRQTHLKQIGHFCRVASSSLFEQLTQIVGTDASAV